MARYSNPVPQILDSVADPIPGAKLFFFEPGTTTEKDTFSDSGLTTPNTNPVIADSNGRYGDIFLDGIYKVVQQDASGTPTGFDGVTIWTRDPVGDTTEGQFQLWLNDNIYNIPDLVLGSDDNYYRSLIDSNQGNDPTSTPSAWEQIEFERIYNANIPYGLGDRAIGSDGMLYFSMIASNLNNNPVTETTADNWRAADQDRAASAGGAVDAITATFIPAVSALKDGLRLRVTALGSNATTTPTFSPNGLAANPIVKLGGQALDPSDIAGPDHELDLVYDLGNTRWELMNPAQRPIGLSVSNLFQVEDQRTSGTNGGTFTAGSWQTRVLNTELVNNITGASLSSNQITLPAGDYWVEASAPQYRGTIARIRLQNITDASTEVEGGNSISIASGTGVHNFMQGAFTLAAEKTLELQHRGTTTKSTDGFGRPMSIGDVERYSEIRIWKV